MNIFNRQIKGSYFLLVLFLKSVLREVFLLISNTPVNFLKKKKLHDNPIQVNMGVN
jgi:hypothetical protein